MSTHGTPTRDNVRGGFRLSQSRKQTDDSIQSLRKKKRSTLLSQRRELLPDTPATVSAIKLPTAVTVDSVRALVQGLSSSDSTVVLDSVKCLEQAVRLGRDDLISVASTPDALLSLSSLLSSPPTAIVAARCVSYIIPHCPCPAIEVWTKLQAGLSDMVTAAPPATAIDTIQSGLTALAHTCLITRRHSTALTEDVFATAAQAVEVHPARAARLICILSTITQTPVPVDVLKQLATPVIGQKLAKMFMFWYGSETKHPSQLDMATDAARLLANMATPADPDLLKFITSQPSLISVMVKATPTSRDALTVKLLHILGCLAIEGPLWTNILVEAGLLKSLELIRLGSYGPEVTARSIWVTAHVMAASPVMAEGLVTHSALQPHLHRLEAQAASGPAGGGEAAVDREVVWGLATFIGACEVELVESALDVAVVSDMIANLYHANRPVHQPLALAWLHLFSLLVDKSPTLLDMFDRADGFQLIAGLIRSASGRVADEAVGWLRKHRPDMLMLDEAVGLHGYEYGE